MPSTEKITRLGIFLATGYLCAGIVVTIFVGLPLWVNFFSSEFYIGALITIVTMVVAAVIGIIIMRALVARYGLKPIFDMDVLILMIGVLFLALSMNQAMVVVGLLVCIGGGTLYFIENFSEQMKAASAGGIKALSLIGWALGPIIAVLALTIYADHGILTLRILLAHYIVIAFWVWVQRLSLHEDYAGAPEFLHRLFERYQRESALRAEQDLEFKKNRFAKLYSAMSADPKDKAAVPAAPKAAAPAPKAAAPAPKAAAPAAPKAEVKAETKPEVKAEAKPEVKPEAKAEVKAEPETKSTAPVETKTEPTAPAAAPAAEPKAEAKEGLSVADVLTPAETKAEEKTEAKAENTEAKAEEKPEAKPESEAKAEDKAETAEAKTAAMPTKKKKGWLW